MSKDRFDMVFIFQVPRNQWFLTIVENLRVKIFYDKYKITVKRFVELP
jgi:hypothetical protein